MIILDNVTNCMLCKRRNSFKIIFNEKKSQFDWIVYFQFLPPKNDKNSCQENTDNTDRNKRWISNHFRFISFPTSFAHTAHTSASLNEQFYQRFMLLHNGVNAHCSPTRTTSLNNCIKLSICNNVTQNKIYIYPFSVLIVVILCCGKYSILKSVFCNISLS